MIYDQASELRKKLEVNKNSSSLTKVITVTSGKGGVGKSNITLNFALSLIESGNKAAIIDADIGLANIDVLMGISPKYTILDLLNSHLEIWDIIEKGPNGLEFIAGGSDLDSIFDIKKNNFHYLLDQLSLLNGHIDTLLIDTGAGMNQESLKFILSSDEVFLITTPEPTAITDSYAMIKKILSEKRDLKLNLIINQVSSEEEGHNTANRIKQVSERFLDYKIDVLGYIYKDDLVSKAVKKQEPFYLTYPNSKASKSIKLLVNKYTNSSNINNSNGVKFFIEKMSNWLRK